MSGLPVKTDEFRKRANRVHGGRYEYDRTVYKGRHSKLTVTCRIHGDFEQTAGSHLTGRGCAKCSGRAKLTTDDFVNTSKKVHGDKYRYDKVKYIRAICKVLRSGSKTTTRYC
ncbi:conserved hypothetical protein [Vibrio phage 382E49-1]|nr:conserved hypothetical protein [Vibrio phage 382E49-1]